MDPFHFSKTNAMLKAMVKGTKCKHKNNKI